MFRGGGAGKKARRFRLLSRKEEPQGEGEEEGKALLGRGGFSRATEEKGISICLGEYESRNGKEALIAQRVREG